jgi:hypothetical protein
MAAWTPELLHEHFKDRLDRAEAELRHRMDGFPQEYATRAEMHALRTVMEEMRVDHVQRREVEELKGRLDAETDGIHSKLDEATGRRTAGVVAITVVMSLVGITLGVMARSGLTHADVSQQIQTEAPWVTDRPDVERRLRALETENEHLRLQIAAMQQLDKFFCRTRVLADLPAC